MADQSSYPLYQPSKLDEKQIFQGAYDEETQRLRTDAIATISNVSIEIDLDPSEDGVYIADKDSGNKLSVNADGSIDVNIIDGDVDIRDLSATQDSVSIGDGTDTLQVNPDGSINVHSDTSVNVSYIATDIPISTTQVPLKVGLSALVNRKTLILYNRSGANVFIGPLGVTSTTGIRLATNQMITFNIGPAIAVYGVTNSGTCNLIVQELS